MDYFTVGRSTQRDRSSSCERKHMDYFTVGRSTQRDRSSSCIGGATGYAEHTLLPSLPLSLIAKFVATICQILRLKCTKFKLDWGYAPDPAGELIALSWFAFVKSK